MIETRKTAERTRRFSDDGSAIYDFGEEFLVVCPRCHCMAIVAAPDTASAALSKQLIAPRTVRCLSCAFRKSWTGTQISVGGCHDWYFKLPLWLQVPCCGETLWAYNHRHLQFLEDYASAVLRERKSANNRSAASRLPRWLKLAKNRDAVLKAIQKLKNANRGATQSPRP